MTVSLNDVHEIVDNAVLTLTLEFPMYAQFLVRIGYTYKDFGKAIACTDGRTVYINDKMIAEINNNPIRTDASTNEKIDCSIGKKEMIFVLCHELMHLLTISIDRAERLGIPKEILTSDVESQKKLMLWNMATDYAINSLLVNNTEDLKPKPIGKILPTALYDKKYINKTAEEIYNLLKDENYEILLSLSNKGYGFKLDEHLEIDDELVKNGLMNKIAETFGSTTNGISNSQIDRMVNSILKPLQFDWRKALTKYIRNWIKENYTWNKPSRAGIANGLILPSYGKSPRIHIAIAVDTSGSIGNDELQEMFNHVSTIMSAFNDFVIDIWCCGSVVYEKSFKTYTKQNKNTIKDFKIMSDGGNDMRKNFSFMKEHYRLDKPDVFVCLTDGFDEINGDTTLTCSCPVVWLILDNPNFIPPLKMKNTVYPYVVDKEKNNSDKRYAI